jgi:multiple sugar transport system permease protein
MMILARKTAQRRMKLRKGDAVAGVLFALPSFSGFALFFIIPFFMSLYYCFTEGISRSKFVGFANFKSLLQSESFLLAAKNTLIFNAVGIPLIMILSLAFAMLLNTKINGLRYFRSLFILPLVIPVASVILVWQIIFNERGALNRLLDGFGLMTVDWMNSGWSLAVLVLLFLWKNCGYNVVLFLAGLNSIPKEYYESARIDGAGPWVCLTKITLPFLMPTGFFVFIISIINSLKVFRESYQLAGNYPDMHIYMLQNFMNNNFANLNYQRLSTAAFLMFVVIGLLVFVLFRVESRIGRDME